MDPTLFYTFIKEREAIRLRRAAGQPWPWTNDPILRKFSFTNVKREHDRTSRILIDQFYEPNRRAPIEEALFNAAIFRYFGTAEFAVAVGWNEPCAKALGRVERVAATRLAAGARVYTGAYMVTNCGRKGAKHELICRAFLADLLRKTPDVCAAISAQWAMEDAVAALVQVDGFGVFMAKEVLLDTRYTDAWQVEGPSDRETWTGVGPGAIRGAARIRYGEKKTISRAEALEICREVYAARHQYWPSEYMPLTLDDIQFQFCEWFKYEKVRLGEGRPRSRYQEPK